MKLVLASNNTKKLKELGEILTPLGWELIPQAQLGVPETDEPDVYKRQALGRSCHQILRRPGLDPGPMRLGGGV